MKRHFTALHNSYIIMDAQTEMFFFANVRTVTFSNVLKCNLYHISLILTLVLKRCRRLKWSHLAVILHLVPSDGYCLKCTLIRCVKCVISKNTSWLSLFFPPPSDHILLLKKTTKKQAPFLSDESLLPPVLLEIQVNTEHYATECACRHCSITFVFELIEIFRFSPSSTSFCILFARSLALLQHIIIINS